MPRRPGDTSPINKSISGTWTLKTGSGSLVQNQSAVIFQDDRPFWSKGARGKIGSKVWIYPTAYSHYSRTINQTGATSYRVLSSFGSESSLKETAPPVNTILTVYAGYGFNTINSFERYNVQSAAQVKALNKLGDEKAQIGADLATYMQLVRMFKGKTSLLYDILNAMKKGKMRDYLNRSARDLAKNGEKKAADAYLEYVYGWKPLVSEIYGVYQLLQQYSNGVKPLIIHGHGSQKMSTNWAYTSPESSKGANWQANFTVTEKFKGTCDLYGRVDPQYIAFRILNQLGLLNPAAIVWEATPWSFVVDWLIPIGPMISAFTAPIGVNFISGTTATRATRSFKGEYHSYLDSTGGKIVENLSCPFTATDEQYARVTHSTWPFPTPYLNLNPLSGDRSFKALALAISNLKRGT